MLVARKNLPKTIQRNRNPLLSFPSTEELSDNYNDNDSDKYLEGQGVEKITIPSTMIDKFTRLKNRLGLKLSGHYDTLTEPSNLINEIYKRDELQTEQQYRNAPNKFHT